MSASNGRSQAQDLLGCIPVYEPREAARVWAIHSSHFLGRMLTIMMGAHSRGSQEQERRPAKRRFFSTALGLGGLVSANAIAGRALVAARRATAWETRSIGILRRRRTRSLDRGAQIISTFADVPGAITHGVIAALLLRRATGSWRAGALPLVALSLETASYLATGALVKRPRPDVWRLDHEQPTSSFPSGHEGAAVALMVVYWRLAADHRPAARAAIRALCLTYPALIAWSRVYLGMHHPSDVIAGAVTGAVAGDTAWRLTTPRM